MDEEIIINLLNKDIADEHGAIVQYLSHAYAIGEGEMTCEIEASAREEMRHLDWLAEKVIELGGQPALGRGTMHMGGHTVSDWMNNNVQLEEGAITHYKEHIDLIDNPQINRLLRRILSDEESHHGDFVHFVDKAKRERTEDTRGTHSDEIMELLNWGIEHEYTVILQYLFQSYTSDDEEVKEQLQDQAINEMQHLGWLAEKIVSRNGNPRIEHGKVSKSTDRSHMLRQDIKIEKNVAETYNRGAKKAEDPKVKKLLERLRDHELYHAEVFDDLLEEDNSQKNKPAE
jgi:bacterioferritin